MQIAYLPEVPQEARGTDLMKYNDYESTLLRLIFLKTMTMNRLATHVFKNNDYESNITTHLKNNDDYDRLLGLMSKSIYECTHDSRVDSHVEIQLCITHSEWGGSFWRVEGRSHPQGAVSYTHLTLPTIA